MHRHIRSIDLRSDSRSGLAKVTQIVLVAIISVVVSIAMMASVAYSLFLPAVERQLNVVKRTGSMQNLSQLAIALHNFSDVNDYRADRGSPEVERSHHSWMTNLLPFIEQRQLFEALESEKPWNALENQAVFSNVVRSYVRPMSQPHDLMVGNLGAAHYAGNSHLMAPERKFSVRQIKDGAANTILVGEVATACLAWGDPSNVRDPAAGVGPGANQFRCREEDNALFIFADGSVRTVSSGIDQQTLKALATPAGSDSPGEF